MASTLRDICFDCSDAGRVGSFWSSVFGHPMRPENPAPKEQVALVPPEGTGIRIWFTPVPEPKTVKNRVHIDINMPDEAELDRLLSLGASKLDEIRGEDGALWWTIMADPEGNEFCAFPPRTA